MRNRSTPRWGAVTLTAILTLAAPGAVPARPTCTSGACMPVGDRPGWRKVFSDDFATALPAGRFPSGAAATWGAYPDGWHDTSGQGTYMPSKVVTVHDGVLDMHLRTESGSHLVSAIYPKLPDGSGPKGGHEEGRYVIRFRTDQIPGYKLVCLLWPDSGDNLAHGEVDFPEADLDMEIYGYVHHRDAANGSDQDWFATGAAWTTWHTAVIERTASSISYWLDDVLVGRSTDRLPVGPMGWVIQAETSLSAAVPNGSSGHIYIDWVAAYLSI